ncbi:MAG: CocE/NonD family hydrolase [Anaerolineae bacterium]|nr:CocE/NonD family hydrolase [Anaerolineae bacterium]
MNKKRRFLRWLLAGVLGVLLILVIAGVAVMIAAQPNVNGQSLYVTMSDGTQIAIDVWLPKKLAADAKLPTLLRSTRYWRSYAPGPIAPLMPLMGNDPYTEAESWTQAGYALVVVDVRGSGASFGQWSLLWSAQEIADLGEVVDWIVAQPWSNGRVGAYGVSYDGNTAEMLTALNHPAVKAVAPQYDDFDAQAQLILPGGVYNRWFSEQWDDFTRRLDANDVCALAAVSGTACDEIQYAFTGVKPVDADPDGVQLAAAVQSRAPLDLTEIVEAIEYREDEWGDSGQTLRDVSPYGQRSAIEASGVPMYVWVSWLDSASVEGALARYLTFSNPQKLVIGPWAHGGGHHADPFLPPDTPTDPPVTEQFEMLADFFDAFLKDAGASQPAWDITYYTLGAGTWQSTMTWPPEGFAQQSWYFGPEGTLATESPASADGADAYTVDWTATTGDMTRWHTGLAMADVVYPDRATEDEKLLTYTSAPLETALEITGNPIVTLYAASTASDGAFHVYLEDVAPDGHVTYITEGILRAIHRAVSTETPPYVHLGPYHSFERGDAGPLTPGEITELRITLYATSVLISRGHRIRIAIAGHDASVFARYPAERTPVITMQRNSMYASRVELPVKFKQ